MFYCTTVLLRKWEALAIQNCAIYPLCICHLAILTQGLHPGFFPTLTAHRRSYRDFLSGKLAFKRAVSSSVFGQQKVVSPRN
jgi:hypothetical protein